MKQTALKIVILIGLGLLIYSVADAVTNPAPNVFIDWKEKNTVSYLITFIIRRLLEIAGVLAVLFIIIGGFQYILSGTNQELAESGKKTVTNAIIGVIVIILSYVIVTVINNAIG